MALVVIVVVAGGAVLGNFRSGDGPDRPADEGSGFVTDERARPGAESTADERSPFPRRAGGEGGDGDEPQRDEA